MCGPDQYLIDEADPQVQIYIRSLETALEPFADAARHIPAEAEMLDVGYMLDGEAGCEPVAFEGAAFHRAHRALLRLETPDA